MNTDTKLETASEGAVALTGPVRHERSYAERMTYACKVCGNVPDENGLIEHGKGCYTQSSDGGGTSYIKFEVPNAMHKRPAPHTEPENTESLRGAGALERDC